MTEADFRTWFEQHLDLFGIKQIVLSQEVCPDYVVIMNDGRVAKIEAELFAINFRYHRHDHAKADYIVACYSKTDNVDGVPVLAVNKLWTFDVEPLEPLPPDGELTEDEASLLASVHFSAGASIMAFANGDFHGDQAIFIRFPPSAMSSFPRGSDDSLLTVMPAKAKAFIKKHHHALIATGLSERACTAIEGLRRRGLIAYRPLAFLAALYDGTVSLHPGWLPTEVYATEAAWTHQGEAITTHLFPKHHRPSTLS